MPIILNPSVFLTFFLGLGLLILSDLIGFLLFKKNRKNIFFTVFFGLCTILASYATVKGKLNSIGLLVLLWLIGVKFIFNGDKEEFTINFKYFFQRHLKITLIWLGIFLLKVSGFWNYNYDAPNLMFVDYQYYMKIAEGYNLTGNENSMGLKNGLIPFLDFAQPYRSNDLWIVSLGLDLTKLDTVYIWELFYSTILLTVCSLSLFVLLEKKYNIFSSLLLSILLLFAFSGQWYRYIINLLYPTGNSGSYDPIGIIAYTKLSIVFAILFQFFNFYCQNKKREAIYLLLLIPLLVQSVLGTFLLAFVLLLFEIFKEKKNIYANIQKNIKIVISFIIIVISFIAFYKINQQQETASIGLSNLNIVNNLTVINFIIVFFKKFILLFVTYYWLSIFIFVLLLYNINIFSKKEKIELLFVTVCAYFVSILLYAQFNNVGDAYQFSTNFFGPFIISIIIFLAIQTPYRFIRGKVYIFILILVSLLGMKAILGGNNVFHSTTKLEKYDINFIKEVKVALQKLDYPYGILYYGKDFDKHPREDFPQHETTFLKLFGRNFDAFNIQADSLHTRNQFTLQKENLYIKKNAINIWIHNKSKEQKKQIKPTRINFYDAHPFSFCISKEDLSSLPKFIRKDVVKIIKDDKTGIVFYLLDNSKKMQNAGVVRK